ncbi:MAG: hypothetical protein HN534_03650 [Euryarchaeota archaeon]|jgi:hypothetical protein|nr:hypothetical protein [Euryarchaeota archaeon]MBT3654008.1 hypothetical protein [Euryarchaeota archaeon]MBT3758200.1 hypothetical protein [Euryarchaeota archaeon]MBT4051254.1 hypothetical protein [Euryarchaeota archaeon]MBT4346027.1 hypothetical protein [Euryarchaeota archaeon]
MEALATIIILLHPIAALGLIWVFFNQRKWRKEGILLKSDNRKNAVKNHEEVGEKLTYGVIGVILLAFVSKAIYYSIINGSFSLTNLLPGHFHGWVGLLGLVMILYLRKLGRTVMSKRDSGQSFSQIKDLHGRVSDIMVFLIVIHAFLGFLYLFKYL